MTDCNLFSAASTPIGFQRFLGRAGTSRWTVTRRLPGFRKSRTRSVVRRVLRRLPGFLDIAVDNMAAAIRKISIARGHDVTRYTLACFGGAGGQHACAVADALGMERILVHPLAGVLSAYGIGIADVKAIRETSWLKPLETDFSDALEGLQRRVRDALAEQGVRDSEIELLNRARLRAAGSDSTLEIDIAPIDADADRLRSAPPSAVRLLGGRREVIVDALVVEGVGRSNSSSNIAPIGKCRRGVRRSRSDL